MSWGLWPRALQGASSRILSNDFEEIEWPSTDLHCSWNLGVSKILVASQTKGCTLLRPNCWQRFFMVFTLASVLSNAMITPCNEKLESIQIYQCSLEIVNIWMMFNVLEL